MQSDQVKIIDPPDGDGFLKADPLGALRLVAVVTLCSGLVGFYFWGMDVLDRDDGDSLRWGFFHNPFMQFPIFNELFLEVSLYALCFCAMEAVIGGLLLLFPIKWAVYLVIGMAQLSIVINASTAFCIVCLFSIYAHRADRLEDAPRRGARSS